MLNKLTIQRSLMIIVGLLMLSGMIVLTLFLAYMQYNARGQRNRQLFGLVENLSATSKKTLSDVGAASDRIITDELADIQSHQYRESLRHQRERAQQLAGLMASFVAPYLARRDDAQIDDVCRSAAYDSDIGVMLVEDINGYYYGGYYREDHPGLLRRLSVGQGKIPFGADRVARALADNHADSTFEVVANINDPRDVTRQIGLTRLFMLNDRLVADAENLASRTAVLRERTLNAIDSEAARQNAEQAVIVDSAMDDFQRSGERSDWRLNVWSAVIILLVLTCTLAVIFVLLARLLRPLREATFFAAKLGKGELETRLLPPAQYDANRLATALNNMADALQARGDESRTAFTQLQDVLGRVGVAATRLDGGARDIAASSQGFASGLSDLRLALTGIASTMHQMERHSAANAQNATKVAGMSNEAQALAKRGEGEMQAMLISMNTVTEVYDRLAGMVKTIDDIAFQTNLLAINAAVEAAHAGRYGKGFTVVADEVRRLSARSARSAAEAKEQMEEAEQRVAEAQERARVTAEALRGIVESTREVTQSLGTVENASREQLEGVQSANVNMARIGNVAQSGLDEARRIATTTGMLSEMARQLNLILERSHYSNRPILPEPPAETPRALPEPEE